MRDLQRLERLSSTAALGLWADDVVLALDRAATGRGSRSESDVRLLGDAAEVLDAAWQRTDQPLVSPRSARALAATDTTLSAVAALLRGQSEGDRQHLLEVTAKVVRGAASGSLTDGDGERVQAAMKLFGIVGEQQLVESNSVLSSSKDARVWTETKTISNFS